MASKTNPRDSKDPRSNVQWCWCVCVRACMCKISVCALGEALVINDGTPQTRQN